MFKPIPTSFINLHTHMSIKNYYGSYDYIGYWYSYLENEIWNFKDHIYFYNKMTSCVLCNRIMGF